MPRRKDTEEKPRRFQKVERAEPATARSLGRASSNDLTAWATSALYISPRDDGVVPCRRQRHELAKPFLPDGPCKVKPHLPSRTFGTYLLSLPLTLSVVTALAMIHDLAFPFKERPCWKYPGPDWLGLFVHFLAMDLSDERIPGEVAMSWSQEECKDVFSATAIWPYFTVLLITWGIVLTSSLQALHFRRSTGVIHALTDYVRNNTGEWLHDALATDAMNSKWMHAGAWVGLQLLMLLVDALGKQYKARWCIWYQVVWLSFITTFLLSKAVVAFCSLLTRTLIDIFIEKVLTKRPQSDYRTSWLDLAELHKDLELDIIQLWDGLTQLVLAPAVPFVGMAALHFLCSTEFNKAAAISVLLVVAAGLVLLNVLYPLGKIDSMMNSSLAFKGVLKGEHGKQHKPGSKSIVAVARSYVKELPARSSQEDGEYNVFLEYVQGKHFHVALGMPGVVMIPISKHFLYAMLCDLIFKFPILVSLLVSMRTLLLQATD
eukprot:TRINITY_DN37354_c0_g1_i1.p1 TRINITY_DN37354_c0_g1~~TRINITY_DN37354_c0_g1_i1.p1  ORF type:complete len:489 (+),score=71.91 TRINITY_DN37354_c0_g1_i1:89-1555(+)